MISTKRLPLATAVLVITLAPPAFAGDPCCKITAIDARTGVITAKVTQTGQTFQFQVSDRGLLSRLSAGKGVFANLRTKQVSLDGKSVCCTITAFGPAGAVHLPGKLPAGPASPKETSTREAAVTPTTSPTQPDVKPGQDKGLPVASAPADITIASPAANPPRPVAYLINGYSGCCAYKMTRVEAALRQRGVRVVIGNWNDLYQKRNPGGFMPDEVAYNNDEPFIRQMREEIAKLPPTTPIILIGHSFGGDALLQVVKRIDGRQVAFLAVLDAVGRGGFRNNVTKPVPSNVRYFFNRWQQNSPALPGEAVGGGVLPQTLPFDSNFSGNLSSNASANNQGHQNTEKSAECKTKYRDPFKTIPQLLEHSEVPVDGCIQTRLINALEASVF